MTNLPDVNVTGQALIDSDRDLGLLTAVELINELAVVTPDDAISALRKVLSVDPPSARGLTSRDVPEMVELAHDLRAACQQLARRDVDSAAGLVNDLLARYSAHPHLARESGQWRLHHHPEKAEVVPMWTAITADALARLIGDNQHDRVGVCAADDCARAYVDTSKNQSRRFCSTTCQNRVKAAVFRRRQRTP